MKILIVEDEPGPREGLRDLLRQSSADWTVLEPCAGGLEGLEAIRKHHPDLIISDIRMPGLDGLEMIRAFRASGTDATVLILSGYADFEYARQCLSLGVQNYLVKPVTAQVILEAVRSAEDQRPADRELLEWIESGGSLPEPGLLFLFRSLHQLSVDHRKSIMREVLSLIPSRKGSQKAYLAEEREFYFFVSGADRSGRAEFVHLLDRLRLKIPDRIIGCVQPVVPGEQVGANDLRRWLKEFLLEPMPELVWGAPSSGAPLGSMPLAWDRELANAPPSKAHETAITALENFRAAVFRAGFDPQSVLAAHRKMIFNIQNRWKDLDTMRFEALRAMDPAARVEAALDHIEVKEIFGDVIALLSTPGPGVFPADNQKIQAVLNFLEDRWALPPSLAECAEAQNLSPEHLSRLFKSQLGIGFAKYVVRQRVERAKLLLSRPETSIQEAATLLGFQNAKYFSTVFQKETGVTPSEFRERLS